MNVFYLLCLFCGILMFLSRGNIDGSLDYSQVYCEDCKLWYTPKNIGEINYCSKCKGNNVHRDE